MNVTKIEETYPGVYELSFGNGKKGYITVPVDFDLEERARFIESAMRQRGLFFDPPRASAGLTNA